MSNPKTIKIDEVEYVRSDAVNRVPEGPRAVVVVDRGWIFAGDVVQVPGRIALHNAVWIRGWSEIGFDGVLDDPFNKKVVLKKLDHIVDIPSDSEIFRIPVGKNWGLK